MYTNNTEIETDSADENELMLDNILPCVHCYGQMCSAELLTINTFQPIYVDIEDNDNNNGKNKSIDINIIVAKLPKDILIKIYNDYIRPHKFAQLFNLFTTNTVYTPKMYKIHITEFIKHFHIFVYNPIRNYLMRIDPEFNKIFRDLTRRNYKSIFHRIINIKSSIFIELLMYKYH